MTTEIRFAEEGRTVRFTDFIDAESLAFEAQARALLADAPIEQRLIYYRRYRYRYFVLQIRGKHDEPVFQTCIHVGRPRFLPGFAKATIRNYHPAPDPEHEEFGLRMLQKLGTEMHGVMTLRIQPRVYDSGDLLAFQARARRAGFLAADESLSYTKTLILDLDRSPEALLARLPSRTRQKIRHHSRQRVTLCALDDPRYLQACRDAANVARIRTGAGPSSDDFETCFELARSHPDRCKIIGLFFNHRPADLLAYVIGFNNGRRVEFYSAGAVFDPELRSIPFNSLLVWELMNWARHQGCKEMDLGGITEGGPNDPLQGITQFKRGLSEVEAETGREMIAVVRPFRHRLYNWLKQLKEPNRDGGLAPANL